MGTVPQLIPPPPPPPLHIGNDDSRLSVQSDNGWEENNQFPPNELMHKRGCVTGVMDNPCRKSEE